MSRFPAPSFGGNVRLVSADTASAVLRSFLLTAHDGYKAPVLKRRVLSKLELKVGVRVAAGMSIREAAADLGWALPGCHKAMAALLRKTGIGCYSQLRRLAEPLDTEEKLNGFLVSMVQWQRRRLPEGTTIRYAPEAIGAM